MRTRLVLLIVFLVLGTSIFAAASVTNFSYDLHARKSLMSIPAVPLNPDPAAVFGSIPIDYRLLRWDAVGKGTYPYDESNPALFGNMLIGEGYWMTMGSTGDQINYDGLTDTDSMDIWISLPKHGWSLIGNPFSFDYTWANAKVTDGNETISLQEASQYGRDWIYSVMTWWDSTGQGTHDVGLPDDAPWTEQLNPWHGYWVYTQVDKIALILESPL